MPSGRRYIEAGVAAAGLAGAVAASQVLLRRVRVAPDETEEVAVGPTSALLPDDVTEQMLLLSDGTLLRVLSRGDGPAVVLLHGITLSADVWYKQLQDLGDAGFRVIAPDLRGHGRSTVGTGGLELDRVAGDVAELLVALDLRDAILVGHSMGGMLALRLLARQAPDGPRPGRLPGPVFKARRDRARRGDDTLRVRALALVATSASPVVGRGVPGARAVVALAGPMLGATGRLTNRLLGPTLPDTAIGDPVARAAFGSSPVAADVRLVRRVTSSVPARIAASFLLQLLSFDAEAQLGRVSVPTTVVAGTADVMTPLGHAEKLARSIPGAELVVLPDCGHMVMLERRDELAAAICALALRAAGPGRTM
jgi:pimeloyl-ACP methyl ester carboxylesterase